MTPHYLKLNLSDTFLVTSFKKNKRAVIQCCLSVQFNLDEFLWFKCDI